MQLTDISFKVVITTIAVLILVIEIYNKFYTARKNLREQKAAHEEPVAQINNRLDDHGRRIEKLEESAKQADKHDKDMNEGLMTLMRSTLAMTRHMRDGNNMQGLKESEKEITDYLTR